MQGAFLETLLPEQYFATSEFDQKNWTKSSQWSCDDAIALGQNVILIRRLSIPNTHTSKFKRVTK